MPKKLREKDKSASTALLEGLIMFLFTVVTLMFFIWDIIKSIDFNLHYQTLLISVQSYGLGDLGSSDMSYRWWIC